MLIYPKQTGWSLIKENLQTQENPTYPFQKQPTESWAF